MKETCSETTSSYSLIIRASKKVFCQQQEKTPFHTRSVFPQITWAVFQFKFLTAGFAFNLCLSYLGIISLLLKREPLFSIYRLYLCSFMKSPSVWKLRWRKEIISRSQGKSVAKEMRWNEECSSSSNQRIDQKDDGWMSARLRIISRPAEADSIIIIIIIRGISMGWRSSFQASASLNFFFFPVSRFLLQIPVSLVTGEIHYRQE